MPVTMEIPTPTAALPTTLPERAFLGKVKRFYVSKHQIMQQSINLFEHVM